MIQPCREHKLKNVSSAIFKHKQKHWTHLHQHKQLVSHIQLEFPGAELDIEVEQDLGGWKISPPARRVFCTHNGWFQMYNLRKMCRPGAKAFDKILTFPRFLKRPQ